MLADKAFVIRRHDAKDWDFAEQTFLGHFVVIDAGLLVRRPGLLLTGETAVIGPLASAALLTRRYSAAAWALANEPLELGMDYMRSGAVHGGVGLVIECGENPGETGRLCNRSISRPQQGVSPTQLKRV